MTLSSLSVFIVILLGTIALSFFPERWLKPKKPTLNKLSILIQSVTVSLLFLVLTLIVQRPVFSGIAILLFLSVLVVVSNAKYFTLKEPMVFSDIAMFSQAFKHPRLYFPFLGLAPLILGPLIIAGLIYTVLTLEPAMPLIWQRVLGTLILILLLAMLLKKWALKPHLSLIPEADNSKNGLLNSLCCYAYQAGTAAHKETIKHTLKSSPFFKATHSDIPPKASATKRENGKQPNITVIQSESFFDARRLHPSIKRSVLKNFDICNSNAVLSGKLRIPAWGANTMRSEFSFLSGVPNANLGLYQYYPYQYLSKTPLYTLASALRASGYYCVCIHPHPASFFGRDRIFPNMGFDEFIDIEQFDKTETFGPYISDQSITNKILEATKNKTDKPLFIFAITMENHGPLHLEKVTPEETSHYYETSDNQINGLNDLTVYLRHLKNADQMIETLTQAYTQENKDTVLCFYGDHVPSMPKVYASTKYSDDCSDYFIWHSDSKVEKRKDNIDVESLAMEVLKTTT